MSQTSYSRKFVNAFSGMLGDSAFKFIRTLVNSQGTDIPAGIGVKDDSTEGGAVLPSASTDKLAGIVVNSFARDPGSAANALSGANAIKAGNEMNVLAEGSIFVLVEENVASTDPVFVRFATGAGTQLGAIRKSADNTAAGTANVVTVTPTAVDATIYLLRVEYGAKVWEIEFLSGTSTTATLICNGLRAVMAADAELSALVVASGTATLVLTAQDKTSAITAKSEGDGALAVANTTPYVAPGASARQVKGSYFLKGNPTSNPSSMVAMLYFSSSVDRAT